MVRNARRPRGRDVVGSGTTVTTVYNDAATRTDTSPREHNDPRLDRSIRGALPAESSLVCIPHTGVYY